MYINLYKHKTKVLCFLLLLTFFLINGFYVFKVNNENGFYVGNKNETLKSEGGQFNKPESKKKIISQNLTIKNETFEINYNHTTTTTKNQTLKKNEKINNQISNVNQTELLLKNNNNINSINNNNNNNNNNNINNNKDKDKPILNNESKSKSLILNRSSPNKDNEIYLKKSEIQSSKSKSELKIIKTNSKNVVDDDDDVDDDEDDYFPINGKIQSFDNNVFLLNESVNTFKPKCKYIDIVYTWVDGTDPKMLQKYGTLKYSLRSVRKNAPWVRKIFIITANQIPSWFNISNNDNVEFIFHDELYFNKSHLPTFSSNSIESNFFNLPNQVSNCFLYLNDDVFFRNPVLASDFFDEKFNAHVYQHSKIISSETIIPNGKLIRNSVQFTNLVFSNRYLDRIWFKTNRYRSDHGVGVFNKQILKMAYKELKEQFESTSSNRFRYPEDLTIPFLHLQFLKRYTTFKVKPSINEYFALKEDNVAESFKKMQLILLKNQFV
ncbi:hypothetical protein DDB_G0268950 [Dictyostelium discoideum AX4]|uniref:Glycosyltransferase n=1 Tax=Dictyostelium discoideum TaxID=44689 RepID=Q55EX8_DICDI|nr:hypothetical protein DDB_G0268950 [Dictyostelium discoideum AX4]EAL73064.1 hypothetical protein DDB_G0268950 [Dictyostelium discoideum AX4]|eukprot:XP_646892.1 hypothetical protein DDB_G0268950 [Dictyostelium discoideum AX4]